MKLSTLLIAAGVMISGASAGIREDNEERWKALKPADRTGTSIKQVLDQLLEEFGNWPIVITCNPPSAHWRADMRYEDAFRVARLTIFKFSLRLNWKDCQIIWCNPNSACVIRNIGDGGWDNWGYINVVRVGTSKEVCYTGDGGDFALENGGFACVRPWENCLFPGTKECPGWGFYY
ncbi:hypothetical protein TWF506_005775 [Arthrobotrys conoides]|uniref:Uncharacterized protein n=1 Tax=Arthrobotrys conoides TaxID=74498 RepID=A0AAN8NUR9_9PEZI